MPLASSLHRLLVAVSLVLCGLQLPPLLGPRLHEVRVQEGLLPRGLLRLARVYAEGGHLLLDLRHLRLLLLLLLWLNLFLLLLEALELAHLLLVHRDPVNFWLITLKHRSLEHTKYCY